MINGPDGLASAGKPLMIVDCSTSDPSVDHPAGRGARRKGITLIDAPLCRTPKDAEEGTLDVMVGGTPDVVARARPVIDCFAGRVVHTGPTGSGHTMKLLNNFVSLGYAAIYSEALALGAKAGLTPQVFDARHPRRPHGLPLLPDLLAICGRARPQRPSLRDPQRAQGPELSRRLRQRDGVANPLGAAVRNSFARRSPPARASDYVPMLSDFVAEANGVSLAPEKA